MCGIVGSFGIGFGDVSNALSTILHRGPDGSGVVSGRNFALGHSRLSIIDVSDAASQPMISQCGRYLLVFNGEIYNYKHLRRKLELEGVVFRSNSDTEVLLEWLIRFGVNGCNALNGIFSFCFYDKDSEFFLLARDRFGVKPLYYCIKGNSICFGSELKAVHAFLGGRYNVDPTSLFGYMTFLWVPGDRTFIDGILRLQPGGFISGKVDSRIEFGSWLTDSVGREVIVSTEGNFQNAIEDLSYLVDVSVKDQLVSDVPVGAFLSGGVDSSIVVDSARRHLPSIQCFTIDSGHDSDIGGGRRDLDYARLVAARLNVTLHEEKITCEDFAADLSRLAWFLEEPIGDPAAYNVYRMARRAKDLGVSVILSGVGGDDVFSGYRRHEVLFRVKGREAFGKILSLSLSPVFASASSRNPFMRRIKKVLDIVGSSTTDFSSYYRWLSSDVALTLFSPEFRDFILRYSVDYLSSFFIDHRGGSALQRMLEIDRRHFLADHNLTYCDKMSMASGVEVRVPLLDARLVDYATRLPDSFLIRKGTSKIVLKTIAARRVGRDVAFRGKQGFGLPLRSWVRGGLRELINDVVCSRGFLNRGIFDVNSVKRLIEDNERGVVDASYSILGLVMFELWCSSID